MSETWKNDWLIKGSGWSEEEVLEEIISKKPKRTPLKTVMVYRMDERNMRKEPIGILMEQRKLERENNNAVGMLLLARKVFASNEEESERILIGNYV